jgi:hypothetical protein
MYGAAAAEVSPDLDATITKPCPMPRKPEAVKHPYDRRR